MEECCSTKPKKEHNHEGHDHDHSHEVQDKSTLQLFLPAILSFALLLIGIAFDNFIENNWFNGWLRLVWYLVAYIPVGLPVLKEAYESIIKGDVFS